MKSFKKILCFALAAVFVFLFAACGEKKKADEEKQQKTEPKATYTEKWLLSPSIKAQAVYSLPIASLNKSTNHYDITFGDSYVVKKGDMFGLIDSNGSIVFKPEFLSIETCPCYDGYIITQKEDSVYTSTYQLSSKYQKAWIYPHECEGFSGLSYQLKNEDMTVSSDYNGKDNDFPSDVEPVVPESMPITEGQKPTGKYTLVTDGKAVGRSDYDCAGVYTDGLCAFKLNGKWGYVNSEGKTVIPFEFDAVQGYNALNYDYDTPYECSEGYVTVLKGGKFGVYSADGEMVIPCQYACLTTVHDGRAYASQDGQTWGILLVDEKISNGISAEENTKAPSSAVQTQ